MRPTTRGRREIRRVEPDDRRRHLAERDPEPVAVRAERHVVRLQADEDAVHDPPPGEIDHGDVAAAAVRDVGEAGLRGRSSAPAESRKPWKTLSGRSVCQPSSVTVPVRVHDDRRTVQRRRDHQRVVEVNALEDVAAVRAERDGEDLVRGLGGDEGDGPTRRRAATEAAGTRSAAAAARTRSLAHASAYEPTGRRGSRELRFLLAAGRGAAWLARWSGGPKVASSNLAAPIEHCGSCEGHGSGLGSDFEKPWARRTKRPRTLMAWQAPRGLPGRHGAADAACRRNPVRRPAPTVPATLAPLPGTSGSIEWSPLAWASVPE